MKKLLIGLVASATLSAQAQTSNTSVSAATSAPATQTSTATSAEAKPAAASKFGATLIFQGFANVGDVRNNGGGAVIDTANSLGVSYKLTDKYKTEVRHNFQARNRMDSELNEYQANSAGPLNSDQGVDSLYKTLDPTIHLSYSSGLSILGAAPMSFGARYYVPVSKDSINARSNGVLRYQTGLSWDLNPKINIEASAQQRIYSYKADAANNATVLRTIGGVSGTYNVNDNVSVYYNPYLDLRANEVSRGDFKANATNQLRQEIGANFVVGKVTINPAWATVATRAENTEGYKGAGTDENSEYDLTILATF